MIQTMANSERAEKQSDLFESRAEGRRRVLVVEDEEVNRLMLIPQIETHYDLLIAENGEEAMKTVEANLGTISLILLDLIMPKLSGQEVLRRLKDNMDTNEIPVIVMTADRKAEVECLELGAMDFLPKPYPEREVMLARMQRVIELTEDRQTIRSTERDSLSTLYNREFFYRYAGQYDRHHPDTAMDAIVIDVNHFHMVNERYGKTYGDDVLHRLGSRLREIVHLSGGFACRREADTFLIYCPQRENYQWLLEEVSSAFSDEERETNRVRLRMGVYPDADKTIDMERRFDRAKSAADTIRNSFTKSFAFYDNTLHDRELFGEQLIEDFQEALRSRQFKIYFQPKFDIRPEIPVLAAAEALVRWQHPRLGLIFPGTFIPLFEDNGLVQKLDTYIWRETAAQIHDWKTRLGFSVPVSVNVSRVDMYDPALVDTFKGILTEFDLSGEDLHLEITESAYTQDSDQIVTIVSRLRELGFKIEMDDFGTGYSSLNMISSLPIDLLKMDMLFIRNAFRDKHDTRLLEIIVDIADYLDVPVIAEGVETEEQYEALRAMGCDYVQGYYFSKPIPVENYEKLVIERQKQDLQQLLSNDNPLRRASSKKEALGKIAYALSMDFERIYYVDTDSGHYLEFNAMARQEDLQIEHSGKDFFADMQKKIQAEVFRDDQERVALSMRRDTLLVQLVGERHFSMTYRLMRKGKPVFFNLKAVQAHTHDDHHIILGITDVDEQISQAKDVPLQDHGAISVGSLAAQMAKVEALANRDALTGVKSLKAFEEAEKEWNVRLLHNDEAAFSIALCKVEGYAKCREQSEEKGDELICKASVGICNVFSHSPVYRIEEDTFAVILTGADYERRSLLCTDIENRQGMKGTVICRIADYHGEEKESFRDVLLRASEFI